MRTTLVARAPGLASCGSCGAALFIKLSLRALVNTGHGPHVQLSEALPQLLDPGVLGRVPDSADDLHRRNLENDHSATVVRALKHLYLAAPHEVAPTMLGE